MATFNGDDDDNTLNGSIKNDILNGFDGNDSIYGDAGGDTLIGGLGNDYLQGDAGVDTYQFSKGDGLDYINNYDTDNSKDIVKFTDVASTEVLAVFEQFNTDDLILQYAGGEVTLQGYFSGDANYRVDKFQFTDKAWDITSIAQQHNGTSYSEALSAFDGMANTLNGLAGDDTLNGGNNADTLNGGIGNDTLSGNDGNDILTGGADNDVLYGGVGNDTLNGGTGSDTLEGNNGSDNYLFSKGDGVDYINNYDDDSKADLVTFTDVASTKVLAVFEQFNTDNLVLQYAGGQLTIESYFSGDANYRVDKFQFTDKAWDIANIAQQHNGTSYGEALSAFDGMANTINGLAGDDTLNGGNNADTLNGGAGNDNLYGGNNADTLNGGAGNDNLYGNNGSDNYLFSKGDGVDYINNYDDDSKADLVTFTDVASTKVLAVFEQFNTDNLVLQYAGGQLTIESYFSGGANYRVDKFQFTDKAWDIANIAQQHNGTSYSEALYAFDGMANTLNGLAGKDTLYGGTGVDILNGGSGYDTLYGGDGGDTLTGGIGNDYLQGDEGADIYVFSQADGRDELNNYDTDGSADLVKFTDLASIDISAVLTSPVNTNHLLIQYGSSSSLTVDYYFSGDVNYRVGQFQFADGISVSNFLVGTSAKDNLKGGAGNDVLSGLAKADKMTGGSGSDLYFVDDAGDLVIEDIGVKGDVDTVKSSVSYDLASNVENLILTGTAAIDGKGNGANNQLTGNSAANILAGGNGDDTLKGGGGADTFVLATIKSADIVKDFVTGIDHLRIPDNTLGILKIGNGDHIIDNGMITATGGFSNTAELVIISSTITGKINTTSAAAIIGSATAAYGAGDTSLFTVSNNADSAVYLFQSANTNAQVEASELTLIGTLQGTAQTALADYAFA
ncbi:MAG: calcium-binding protein [Methylovulum sp.]|uniref:calcium-binding protein n=1 Tax=Methylovulum sp. TaxID=1916980 RepID=UPI00262D191A|nr:calcium-binding protein [Methylovulum sp.]MDD2723337.1 calcium-binding protein [Methylovulum sp.]